MSERRASTRFARNPRISGDVTPANVTVGSANCDRAALARVCHGCSHVSSRAGRR